MNKEELKIYNKNYYETNKTTLAEKAKKKAECPFCNRVVYVVNMEDHKLTKLCKNRENAIKADRERHLKA